MGLWSLINLPHGCKPVCKHVSRCLYLDPNNGTTAKCHYCSHQPKSAGAGFGVCPTNSIIAGDLNDPSAPISQLVTEYETQVQPECGTQPNFTWKVTRRASTLADQDAPSAFMWSDGPRAGRRGPFTGQGRMAEQMVQVGYNAQHKVPWHWPVAAYMVTRFRPASFYS